LLVDDVLTQCLGLMSSKITKKDQMRAAAVLGKLGMVKVLRRVTTSKTRVTTSGEPPSGRWLQPSKVWVDASEEGLV
jgi:hypothetical protein